MKYKINQEMAEEVIYRYLELIHSLKKDRADSSNKRRRLVNLNKGFYDLKNQLRQNGYNPDKLIAKIQEKITRQEYKYKEIEMYVDGAARGNDQVGIENLSGTAFSIFSEGKLLHKEASPLNPVIKIEGENKEYLEVEATNNVAEYIALIRGLEYLISNSLYAQDIKIYSDSSMVVNQVNLTTATRAPHLIVLRDDVNRMLRNLPNYKLIHIPREKNAYTDNILNKMLNEIERQEEKT